MIRLEWTTAITAGLFLSLFLVFASWIFYNLKRPYDPSTKPDDLLQCPICSMVIFDYRKSGLLVCPHCRSLVDQEHIRNARE
jgi:hypothetical protein